MGKSGCDAAGLTAGPKAGNLQWHAVSNALRSCLAGLLHLWLAFVHVPPTAFSPLAAFAPGHAPYPVKR